MLASRARSKLPHVVELFLWLINKWGAVLWDKLIVNCKMWFTRTILTPKIFLISNYEIPKNFPISNYETPKIFFNFHS